MKSLPLPQPWSALRPKPTRGGGRQHLRRIVVVPMRIVGGEQQPVPADPIDRVQHMLARLRLLHRLRRQPDLLADVFGRRALQMRSLYLQPVPQLVQPPRQRRQPGKTRLDQHQLECRDALEHPLDHQAGEERLRRLRMADHVLDIERRPAAASDRIAAEAEGMHADRQPRRRRGLEDLPILLLARRVRRARHHQHLHETRVAGPAFDLRHRRIGILVRHHDGALQPRLDQPLRFHPAVHRGGHAGTELAVLEAGAVVAGGVQDAELNVVLVQQLLLHEGQAAARAPTLRRPGVAAGRIRLALRIGWPCLIRLPRPRPERLRHLHPALLHIREQILVGVALRMDVAVGNGEFCARGRLDDRAAGHLNVHWTVSIKRGKVSRGLSIMILRTRSRDRPSGSAASPSNCQCG